MPSNFRRSDLAANVAADAVAELLNDGYLRIYAEGYRQLAELRFGSPAFMPARNGKCVAGALVEDENASGTGQAVSFRTYMKDGETLVFEGSVGLSDADMNLNMLKIVEGAQVSISTFTFEEKRS